MKQAAALGVKSLKVGACPSVMTGQRACAVSWRSRLGERYKGAVTITRGGLPASPVDTYVIKATGRSLAGTERYSDRGRVVVETRKSAMGNVLRLLDEDDLQVDANIVLGVDGWISPNDYSTPPSGTRWVTYTVFATDSGDSRWETTPLEARGVLGSGQTLETGTAVGCDWQLSMAPGESRQACIAFAVPIGEAITQVEWKVGAETGVWTAP